MKYFLILASTITGCVSISAFISLVFIPLGIAGSAATIKISIMIAEIERHKSIIKKSENKHDEIVRIASKNWIKYHRGFDC